MISTTAHLTIDEFMRLYDEEGPFELINGERIALNLPVFGQSYAANVLAHALNSFASPQRLGSAFIETPFVLILPDNPNWIKASRVPDVMYLLMARIAAYRQANPDWRDQPLRLVPDLVVEIVSPTDRYMDVIDKVERYVQDSVSLIWVLDPRRQTVLVRVAGSNQQTILTVEDTLTGGTVIPGFEISVASIFE